MNLNAEGQLPQDQQICELLKPLAFLLEQKEVTEITINKPEEVWSRSGNRWTVHTIPILTASYLRAMATALIVFNGLGRSSIASVILPQGARGQIVLPPACIDGTLSLSIRKHTTIVKTLEELEQEGCFDVIKDVSFNKPTKQEIEDNLQKQDFSQFQAFEAELLQLKAENKIKEFLTLAVARKQNIVVVGKTASGKTTFARSLIEKVPTEERIVTIEDVHELFLANHPNKVHMLYGVEEGRFSARDCLASCMRQSPDRIFLAELRGDEAWEYLSSLNTGHPGAITTIHANGALQAFERMTSLIKNSVTGQQLNLEAIKTTLYTTVNVVLFLKDFKLTEIFYDPIFAKSKIK